MTTNDSPESNDEFKRVLDPCCATGRFNLRFYKIVKEGKQRYLFFNAEIDLELYRFAIMQFAFYEIPAVCLCCNSLVVDLTDMRNWREFGNKWYPESWGKMYVSGDKTADDVLNGIAENKGVEKEEVVEELNKNVRGVYHQQDLSKFI